MLNEVLNVLVLRRPIGELGGANVKRRERERERERKRERERYVKQYRHSNSYTTNHTIQVVNKQ